MTLPLATLAASMIAAGGMTLLYQRSGKRSFETFLIFAGLSLMACGFAIARDVVDGSSNILWVVHHATPLLSTASAS
jgi:hypothetical protein